MLLHKKMMIGFVLGTLFGVFSFMLWGGTPGLQNFIRYFTDPVGKLFIRLLFMLVLPLIFSGLAIGVSGLGDARKLGRVGFKTLLYTVVVSSIAVILGVVLVNAIQPGHYISEDLRARLTQGAQERVAGISKRTAEQKSGVELFLNIVPDNPLKAAVDMDLLAIMFFAFMIGIGLILSKSDKTKKFQDALEGLYDVCQRLIQMVISTAPYAVACLLFTLTAQLGYEILFSLFAYVGTVVLALAIHQFVVYSLSVKYLGNMSPVRFFRDIQEAMLTAFSTASSNATLPTSLRVAEEKLKLPPSISRFVLTIGSTANQNGSALFEGVTVLFLAQVYGISLGFGQQLMVVLICILGGIGTAGVPAATLPVIMMMMNMLHIPIEGLGLILGVDRFHDMCRTTLNVTGDLAAAVVVSKGERKS